jgi:hypothetical protein
MNPLPLICAVFLTGCAERITTRWIVPDVPAELRRPVVVVCADGTTVRTLGECALSLRAGLDEANGKITAIDTILTNIEGQP